MSTNQKTKKPILSLFMAFFLLMATLPLVHAESMPDDVLARVKQTISSTYPNNYSMQKILLDDQKQSYEFLSTYSPASVPQDVLKKIIEEVSSNYPDNYSMQKVLIEDQVKSYLELNK